MAHYPIRTSGWLLIIEHYCVISVLDGGSNGHVTLARCSTESLAQGPRLCILWKLCSMKKTSIFMIWDFFDPLEPENEHQWKRGINLRLVKCSMKSRCEGSKLPNNSFCRPRIADWRFFPYYKVYWACLGAMVWRKSDSTTELRWHDHYFLAKDRKSRSWTQIWQQSCWTEFDLSDGFKRSPDINTHLNAWNTPKGVPWIVLDHCYLSFGRYRS